MMTVERGLRLVAGTMTLLSVGLAIALGPGWLALTAFIGLNNAQSAFTDWCPMMWVLERAGLPRCSAGSAGPA